MELKDKVAKSLRKIANTILTELKELEDANEIAVMSEVALRIDEIASELSDPNNLVFKKAN
jgi:hypothetical protein